MAMYATSQLEPWSHLGDKVVMVTGASSGIGWEFCLDLARAGCRIVAAARRTDRLENLCCEINRIGDSSRGAQAVAVALDVSADGNTIEVAVRRAWEAFGTIDVLINNAGIRGPVKSSLDLSEEEWNNTIKTNLTGSWLVSKYVCLLMRATNKGGSVINISSIAGLNRGLTPRCVAYAASKVAINTMTKLMAVELGAYNIKVNSISPGIFKSEITEGLVQQDWFNNVALRTYPLRVHCTIDPALTSLVRYLIHDSSKYVSGNIFIVDAGATLPGVPIFSSL
ncbi:uncharacterized protein LOC127789681 [Diospyros lotus]|uniref:uncharacterized protein LOC127789681 n=1 Tax=Diospyros lotus TaxID=55363 RepID=UPI0022559386|nr:uncharacterized protein LOC127789681 [Diospyros lotus]